MYILAKKIFICFEKDMNVSTQYSNISFGTNIKFVSPRDFQAIRLKYPLRNVVLNYTISPNAENSKKCYRINENMCATLGIRTCIGVNIADLENKTSSFSAHLFHSAKNYNNLNLIKPLIKGNNAVIIGKRQDDYAFSSEILNELSTFCNDAKLKTTKMCGLKYGYEADMAYDGESDSLFLCVSKINNKKKYVNNQERLKYAFKNISIESCDNVQFIKEGSLDTDNKFMKVLYCIYSYIR